MQLRDEKGRFPASGNKDAGATGRWEFFGGKMQRAIDRSKFENLRHAAARISKDAKESLQKAGGPSPAGSPPHTHRGAHLRRSVRFAADKESAVIGPMDSIVGTSGEAHEFGGEYKGQDFPERSFMYPALEKNVDRFGGDFRGSIGQ